VIDTHKQSLQEVLKNKYQREALLAALHEMSASEVSDMRMRERSAISSMDDLVRRHDQVRECAIAADLYEHLLERLDKKAGL
jgi:predicted dinucleotide-utilizing enzyme